MNDFLIFGSFIYEEFIYGSGNDWKRVVFNVVVCYKMFFVNVKNLLLDWKGKKKKWWEKYWGFGVDSFLLNGRVFFLEWIILVFLVLMVYGNYLMEDYFDEGYVYLGELLVS